MREITKLDEAKLIDEFLLEIAQEKRDQFAIGFLKYVEETYIKQGDRYYFKHHNQYVHCNIIEVMDNYKYYLSQLNDKDTGRVG